MHRYGAERCGIGVTKRYFTGLARASPRGYVSAAVTSPGANRIHERSSKGQKPGVCAMRRSRDRAGVSLPGAETRRSTSSLIYLALASARCVFIALLECFDRSLWAKLKADRGQRRVSLRAADGTI